MTKTQTKVADRLLYCYRHCDDRDEERMLEWVAEHLADELFGPDPRSKTRSDFIRHAIPGSLLAAVTI